MIRPLNDPPFDFPQQAGQAAFQLKDALRRGHRGAADRQHSRVGGRANRLIGPHAAVGRGSRIREDSSESYNAIPKP